MHWCWFYAHPLSMASILQGALVVQYASCSTAIHKLIHQCIVLQHCTCLVLSYNSQMCGAVDSSFTKMVFTIQVCAIMCNVAEAHCYALGGLIVSNYIAVSINN